MPEIQDVFEQYGEDYRQSHWLSMTQHKTMNAILNCRTAKLGEQGGRLYAPLQFPAGFAQMTVRKIEYGRLAQLGERCVRNAEVESSNLFSSTISFGLRQLLVLWRNGRR